MSEAELDAYKQRRARECAIADGYGPNSVASMTTLEPKPNKYRNRPIGGYSSTKEARRAAELKLLEKAGQIRNLREQVPYLLIPDQLDANGKRVERACRYVADFRYGELRDGNWFEVVEDTKSEITKTPEYRIKKKLMLFVHRIQIKET